MCSTQNKPIHTNHLRQYIVDVCTFLEITEQERSISETTALWGTKIDKNAKIHEECPIVLGMTISNPARSRAKVSLDLILSPGSCGPLSSAALSVLSQKRERVASVG